MNNSKFSKVSIVFIQVLLMAVAISLIFPFVWMLLNSFKTNPEFYQDIWALPQKIHVENYTSAWKEMGLDKYFLNSVFITVLGTFASVMMSAMASYVVAKFDFKGRNFIYMLAVLSFLIPQVASLGSLYKLMIQLRLFNSHLGLIVLYSGGLGMNFIILYGFFKSISWSYAEAAFIDGASNWKVFLRVMIPLAKPGIAAVVLVQGINIWNDYFMPSLFLQDTSLYTLSVGLKHMVTQQSYAADWTTLFAALTMSTIPMLVMYLSFRSKIMDGFTAGGLKG